MSVTQARPSQVIVVADRMADAQAWARDNQLPFGTVIFAKADGDDRSLTVMRGLRGLPYVELVAPNEFTRAQLVIGEHYRVGGV